MLLRFCFLSLYVFCLQLSNPGVHARERLALLIGNAGYVDAVGPLANPHHDIEHVGQALKSAGFDILPRIRDATREQMLTSVYDLAERLEKAGPGAIGFFYYSGHGASATSQGPNYLIPIDAKKMSRRAMRASGVGLNDLIDILERAAPNASKFIVFDACRNELRGSKGSKGFVPVQQRAGSLIAFATALGETAADGHERVGPYARALAQQIAVPGQDHLSLFFEVRRSVSKATQGDQIPWTRDGLLQRVVFTKPTGQPNTTTGDKNASTATPSIPSAVAPNSPAPGQRGGAPARPACDYVQFPAGPAASPRWQCVDPSRAAQQRPFRDCDSCPELVLLAQEQRMLAFGRTEITFDEWDACRAADGCATTPADGGWGRGRQPVINVSWQDANDYVRWLSKTTGRRYRLPSEGEWQFAAQDSRAEVRELTSEQVNYDASLTESSRVATRYRGRPVRVGTLPANSSGLHNMLGNVQEWVTDCWRDTSSTPTSLSAVASTSGDCARRIAKGGAWYFDHAYATPQSRLGMALDQARSTIGFRVVREIDGQ